MTMLLIGRRKKFNRETVRFKEGFTLVELVLAVSLLGVLMLLAVPNMHAAFNSLLLDNCVRDVSSLMRYAQSQAIIRRCVVEFIFDPEKHQYHIFGKDSAGKEKISSRWRKHVEISNHISAQMTPSRLCFYPDGYIDQGRFIGCQGGRCMTVSTQEQRGRILVLNGKVD